MSVYVLYNPVYDTYGENVYKIGRTIDLSSRIKGYSTSYIEPSILKFSIDTENHIELEKNVHRRLKDYRINPKREYFKCDLQVIIDTIEEENKILGPIPLNKKNDVKIEDIIPLDKDQEIKWTTYKKVFSVKQEVNNYVLGYRGDKSYNTNRVKDRLDELRKELEYIEEFLIQGEVRRQKNILEGCIKDEEDSECSNEEKEVKHNRNILKKLVNKGVKPLDLSQYSFDGVITTLQILDIFKDIIRPFYTNKEGKISAVLSDRDRLVITCLDSSYNVVRHNYLTIYNFIKNSSTILNRKLIYKEEEFTVDTLPAKFIKNILRDNLTVFPKY